MAPVLALLHSEHLSHNEADQVLKLWDQRPKGRPTKREQALYTMARQVIPEVRRPVGRPRKH